MLSCIAIDDEPLALQKMHDYILRVGYLDLLAEFDNALEALEFLKSNKVDLIFLDIMIPPESTLIDECKNGMEMGWVIYEKLLRDKNTPIIVWTRHFPIFQKDWDNSMSSILRYLVILQPTGLPLYAQSFDFSSDIASSGLYSYAVVSIWGITEAHLICDWFSLIVCL